jgi:hypothetical protein
LILKDGSKDLGLESLDANNVRGLCSPSHFHSGRRSRNLLYRQFVVEGKFRPPTKERSEETEFSVKVSHFQTCVGQ